MVAVNDGLIVNTVGDVLTQPENTAQPNSIITEKMPFFIPDISAKIYNFKFKIQNSKNPKSPVNLSFRITVLFF